MMLRFRSLWRNLVRRSRVDRDLDDELSGTLDALVQEKMQRGMTADEARRAARLELGSVESIKEQVRDVRAGALLATLLQNGRYACRLLARSPGFTAAAVLTLTLGIGANTAIFSVLDELLLRYLPVEEPQRLVIFAGDESRTWKSQVSYPLYTQLRDRNDVLSGLIALNGTSLVLDADGSVERISGEIVSGNYFSVLGLKAALGRTFLPEEDRVPGARPVALISHGFWRRRFGSDPGVVGKNVRLNGYPFTVIGVAPEGFAGTSPGRRADIFVPVMMLGQMFPLEAPKLTQSGNNWLNLLGRLNPGMSRAQAQASLRLLAARLQHDVPEDARKPVFIDDGGHGNTDGVQDLARPMTFLAGTAALVLLIACANLAHLLLARATVRQREIAVRLALGAGPARILRQLLIESLLLSVTGGVLGLLVGIWSARGLSRLQPQIEFSGRLDLRMVAFTLLLALLTPMVFGLIPALRAATGEVTSALQERSAASGQAGRWRELRQLLVVPQVALSLAVLICATLSLRSLQALSGVDVGFEPSRVLIAPLSLEAAGYSEARGRAFYSRLLDRVAELPGVESASLALRPHFGGGLTSLVRSSAEIEVTEFGFNRTGPKHFQTLGTPLLQGRDFGTKDVAGGPSVTIINETAAHRFWPDGRAIGQRLMLGAGPTEWQPFEIIGIVGDSRSSRLTEPARPTMYVPLSQFYSGDVTLHIRSENPSAGLAATVRGVVEALDPRLPVEVTPLDERISGTLVGERMTFWLLTAFGLVALALASVGIYGVLAFAVSQRTHEIGVRTALGAQRSDVLGLILRQGMTLTGAGIAIGLTVAFSTTRLLRTLLFNVSPTDPVTFTAVPLLLICVALVACWLPARRAGRINPVEALRRG